MNKNIFVAVMVSMLLVAPLAQAAGWVDDWLDQKAGSSPDYLAGQQRGYLSGGNFSGRWHNQADYPVTLEAPRVKSGCGGIDVFMGGVSFLNTNYLVNKLTTILSGAAAVSFDLALGTLCEKCSNTIKSFEAMADKLNSMQIDECAASKELVGIVQDENGFRSSEAMREKLGTSIKENKLVSGVSEMWDDLGKQDRANNNRPQPADVADITSGCNAEIRAVFLTGGSLLNNVGIRMGIPTDYIDLMRGLVGDVRLEGAATNYRVSYEPPCPENNPDDLKATTEGEQYAKDLSGTCTQITDTNRDLEAYTSATLNAIATKIETKGALTATEEAFLRGNPLSALPILKTAIGTGTKDTVITGLADITAKAESVQMLSDLYVRVESIARKAREILARSSGPAAGASPEKCADAVFAGNIDANISLMLASIKTLKESAKSSYVASAAEMNSIMSYMTHMQKMESQMTAELTRRYGKDAAARMQM